MKPLLASYKKRRKISLSKEPGATLPKKASTVAHFVIQKHQAKTLHYDFRLEIGKVLKSWAVPKNLPKKPKIKHLAIMTDDHPINYLKFEGNIPEGQYGAGKVEIFDTGVFMNYRKDKKGKPIALSRSLKEGLLEIELKGKKVKGVYVLIHFKEKNWIVLKKNI